MIKKRFGEEFHAAVAERLEIKQVESRKAAGDRKRRVVRGGKREQREGRPERPERPERKTEGKETQQPAQTETSQAQEGAKEAPKRERRRGPREGQ